jgi:hypothetical protein
MSPTRKVYVIVRRWWNYNDEWTPSGEDTLKAFGDRAQAEAYLERCRLHATVERYQYVQGGVGYKIVEMEMPAEVTE